MTGHAVSGMCAVRTLTGSRRAGRSGRAGGGPGSPGLGLRQDAQVLSHVPPAGLLWRGDEGAGGEGSHHVRGAAGARQQPRE